MGNLIECCSARGSSLDCEVGCFERNLPFNKIHLLEFEERLKRLVFQQDNDQITLSQLCESFKDCKAFSDLEVKGSILRQMLTSKYLKHSDLHEQSKVVTIQKVRREIIVNGKTEVFEETSRTEPVETQGTKIWVSALMLLGILYCRGNSTVRATVFFDLLRNGLASTIVPTDRNLLNLYPHMLHLTTIFVQHFTAVSNKQPVSEMDEVEEMNSLGDIYYDMVHEMVAATFGGKEELTKDEFVDRVANECSRYVCPASIKAMIEEKKKAKFLKETNLHSIVAHQDTSKEEHKEGTHDIVKDDHKEGAVHAEQQSSQVIIHTETKKTTVVERKQSKDLEIDII